MYVFENVEHVVAYDYPFCIRIGTLVYLLIQDPVTIIWITQFYRFGWQRQSREGEPNGTK